MTDQPEPDPVAVDVPVDSEHTDTSPSREAAKYRTRLREVEGDVERLTGQLADAQRGHIEAIIGSALTPELFWKLTDPADVLDDTGAVDPDRVRAAARKARQELGAVKPLARGGFTSGAQSGVPAKAPSFADAFTPQRD